MAILVLYGTSEGQTRKIASFVSGQLRRSGEAVTTVDVLHVPPDLELGRFDAVIVAARVRAGRYQSQILRYIKRNRDLLVAIPNAFLSVSMSAANLQPGDMARAQSYVDRLVERVRWRPRRILHVAGARLYTRHAALGRWILGMVDRKALDTSKDHVWTDWVALEKFVTEFAATVREANAIARQEGHQIA